MNPRLVLHVIPGLHTGGAEHMLTALITAKRPQPFSQVVVNLLSGGALTQPIRNAGIPVYELNLQNPLAAMLALPRLARLIARLRPTAIQSWLYYADLASLFALQMSGRRSSTRLYWSVRSSDMDQSRYRLRLALAIKACARLAGLPDAVVANSFVGREVHRALGYRPRAFPVIPNGIDIQRFKPDATSRARIRAQIGISEDKPLVIHAARVDPMKDHASLLAVASALPDIHFVMAGAGTEKLDARKNLTALGVRHDMPDLYAAADLALSTSIFGEGFPNAIAEAMACGLPVVATDVGDSRLIVGNTGIIVSPRDVAAMAAAVHEISQMQKAAKMRRSVVARARIEEKYSLTRAVETFDALHLNNVLPPADFAGS